jgi:hypothetical protein
MRDVSGRFVAGQSGNPAGRPGGRGARAEARRLLEEGAASAVRKAVELAKRGDRAMLRLVVERTVPRAGRMAEDGQEGSGSLLERVRALLAGVAEGRISLEEAKERGKLMELERRTLETSELASRMEAIEAELRRERL